MRKIHPGEILKEEFLIPLNLTSENLSDLTGIPINIVNDILAERRGIIDEDVAQRLAKQFSTSIKFWIKFTKLIRGTINKTIQFKLFYPPYKTI